MKTKLEILADVIGMPAEELRECAIAIRRERMKKELLAKVQLIRDRNTAILPTGEIVARGTPGAMDYNSSENARGLATDSAGAGPETPQRKNG